MLVICVGVGSTLQKIYVSGVTKYFQDGKQKFMGAWVGVWVRPILWGDGKKILGIGWQGVAKITNIQV